MTTYPEKTAAERFNGKLRDELLDREIFDTLLEAKVLIERQRPQYNTIRPHSSLGHRRNFVRHQFDPQELLNDNTID